MRGAQAALSPNLGAPETPAVWQPVHTPLNTSSPVRAGPPFFISCSSKPATGRMRASMTSDDISSVARGRLPDAPIIAEMMTTGRTSAAVTTTTNWVFDLKNRIFSPVCLPAGVPGVLLAMNAPRCFL